VPISCGERLRLVMAEPGPSSLPQPLQPLVFHHISPKVLHNDEIQLASEQLLSCLIFAGFTAQIFDHILTFSDEVDLIWMRPINPVSIVFLLNRYITPLVVVLNIGESFGMFADEVVACSMVATLSYCILLSFISIHSLVALRVCAIHRSRRWVWRVLCISGILYALSTLAIATADAIFNLKNHDQAGRKCHTKHHPSRWTVWLPTIIFEALLFVLTIDNAIREAAKDRSYNALQVVLYCDGIIYFVVVSLCSYLSILIWAFDGRTIGLARPFMLSMVNIAGSRLVLNLKICAAKGTVWDSISSGHENAKSLMVFEDGARSSQDTSGTLSPMDRPNPSRVFRQANIQKDREDA